jgi:hypothetical protein
MSDSNGVSTAQPSEVRHLTTPAALALADLAAIFEDLQTALRCCERLVAELAPENSEREGVVLEALWTTTVLSYTRCFAPGPRGQGLTPEDVTATGLAGDVLGWHKILEQLRRHYADPAVNPREAFSVGTSRDEAGAANGIAVTSVRQPLVDDLTVRQTGAIAFALSQIVDKRIAEQQQVVFAALQSMTPAELEKLPVLDVVQP